MSFVQDAFAFIFQYSVFFILQTNISEFFVDSLLYL